MKKILLSLSLVLCMLLTQAQNFKPEKGDITTEFGLTGGVNSTNFNLNEGTGMLRFRYYKNTYVAYRLGFNVESLSLRSNVYGPVDTPEEGKEGFWGSKQTKFQVNLGIERRFSGTERLAPYLGADLLFGAGFKKSTFENAAGPENAPVYSSGVSSEIQGPGYLSIGARIVIGGDYYIARRLFLGAEAGFGFSYESAGKLKGSTTISGTTTSSESRSSGNNFELKPSMITGVRIGFAF